MGDLSAADQRHSPYCGCARCLGTAQDGATVLHVLECVCRVFAVGRAELLGPSREPRLKSARSAMLILGREITALSFPKLCLVIGRSDHRTAMKGYERALAKLEKSSGFRAKVDEARSAVAATRPTATARCG